MKEDEWPFLLYNVITCGDLARMSGAAFKVYATILMNGNFEGMPEAERCTRSLISHCTGIKDPDELRTAVMELINLGHVRVMEEATNCHYVLVDKSKDIESMKQILEAYEDSQRRNETKH